MAPAGKPLRTGKKGNKKTSLTRDVLFRGGLNRTRTCDLFDVSEAL